MVRLDKLLDAWRADPRVDATVELGSMLLRANVKAPGALPRAFVVEFGDEAARKHATQLGVLDVLSRLFAVSGEGSRAQALYARAASLFPGEARVSELETALRNAGLAVPPPAVAAKLAPPPPTPDPPPKMELPAPRAHAGSLADFAPGAVEARRFPIDSTLLESEAESHSAGSRVAPDHVPEVPTRELESSAIEAAIGDEGIPRRPRAPTVAGLGSPMPRQATPPRAASQPPGAAAAPPAVVNRPAPQRRNKTLVPDAGFAPPAFGAVPPVGHFRPPAVPAEAAIRAPATMLEPASPARMFTPARAFTPPPGGLSWNGTAVAPPQAAARPPVSDDASEGETATGVMTPERQRAAIIDNPTTTQESLTRPNQLAPRAADVSPPTQTRLVPEEAQLRAAAASLIGPGRASDAGGMPPPSPAGAARPAARRAVPARERRRVPDLDDDPPTGVTATDTSVAAPPTGAFDAATQQRRGDGDSGQRTARRDTSELLAAALRPAVPGAPPALGSPAAAATDTHPPVAPPPRMAQPSSPDGVATVARATLPLRPPGVSGPAVKPTLVSRGAPSTPTAKPTLMSPGGRSPARPPGQPDGPFERASSPVGAPPPAPADPGGTELTGRIAKPGPAMLVDEPSHDEVDTRVRPLAPPAPSPMAKAGPAPPAAEAVSPAARAPSWEPKHPAARPSTPDPRREPDDDDGPSTNVIPPSRGAPAPTVAPRIAAAPPRVLDEPSFEELSGDALEILDGPGARPPSEGGDSPTGKLDARAARSTQKLSGTVAPAVVWSPDAGDTGSSFGGVRTKVLTVEESREAGRIDPLPVRDEEWMITPPPPVAPRFGPPPSLPPSSVGFAPASAGPSSFAPSSMPMSGYGPVSSAPRFGPPAPLPPVRPTAPSLVGAPQRRSASPIVVGSIVGVALSLLVAGGAWLYDELSHSSTTGPKAAAQIADVETLILAGRRADLDRADVLLREPAPRSADKDRAMTRLRERSVRALELGSTAGLLDAVAAAKEAGWSEAEVAFAPLAYAVAERDLKTSSALQQKWSGPRGTDAYFMLAAAAASEQRGDRKALELYGASLGLEPRLRPAALRVARAELLEGNEDRGVARIEGLSAQGPATPEIVALRGLAWLRLRRAPGSTAPRPTESTPAPEELPVELRFVPDALRLAAGDLPPAARKAAVEEAIARADTPAVAVLVGDLAFELRVEAVALEIGRKQLALHPTHTPSLVLFAKSALALAKLDVLETVAAGLPLPQQNHIKAVVAYERGDVAVVVQTRAWLGDRDEPGREAIVARAERIAGRKKMPGERIQALGRPEVVGGELVAVDALLDAGDLAGARALVDGWGDPASHPLRALRAARLFRYEGKLTEAEAALDAALPTRPALVERILLEAETPEGRTHARSMLDRGFGDDRALYEAYLVALDGKVPAARKLLDATELPHDDAPLGRRIAAALALAVVGDEERGRDRVRRLAADWPQNPDVQRALKAFPGANAGSGEAGKEGKDTADRAPPPRPPPRSPRPPRRR